MDDFPTKEELKGSRKKRRNRHRNPYARELEDPKYRQRRKGNKNGRRRQKDPELGDTEWDPMADDPFWRSY